MEGVPLIRRDDMSAVLDICGRPATASGTWRDPNNVTQLGSAIRAIHEKFNHRGAYLGVCEQCLKERRRSPPNRFGCDAHAPSPLFWRKGIPTESVEFDNAFRKIKREMKDYKINGDTILTPTEVLILRDYCMNQNSAYFFMIYTIFIMFVKLFLRNNDGQNLDFGDFEQSFFVVSSCFCVRLLLLTIELSDQ